MPPGERRVVVTRRAGDRLRASLIARLRAEVGRVLRQHDEARPAPSRLRHEIIDRGEIRGAVVLAVQLDKTDGQASHPTPYKCGVRNAA